MKKILVLGGTGFVGRRVCAKLAELNWHITVPTRQRALVGKTGTSQHTASTIEYIEADVHDPETLGSLLKACDAVVNLVAILHGNEAAFEQVHVTLPQSLVKACQQNEVTRVLHISALGAALDAPSMYQRSKARGEALLLSAGLDITILRPSVIFGAEDKFLNLFAKLQKVFPLMPLAGANTKFQPVWVDDVAQAVVNALTQTSAVTHTVYEACGPDVVTLKELVQLAARTAGINHGRGRPVIALPDWLGRIQASLLQYMPGDTLMSKDNFDSMKVDNISSGQLPDIKTLGIKASSLAEVVPSYLS